MSNTINPSGQLETVRIRDKDVGGKTRIINRDDLTDNDVVVDDKSEAKKPEKQ
ncbi:hypothetical protein [Collimonas humicola]|uniref:hypothetical protein n=1 Tax=Collimonas humicola TaxID=2825886 RepID=UPI001B8BAC06|nr:hypothetical protein [Collimonas humicola]